MKDWKKVNQAHGNQKQAGVAFLISDKTDISKTVKRDNEVNYILMKVSIQQKKKKKSMYPTQDQIYTENTIRPKKIVSNTVIVGDFNIPLSSVERLSRHKINKNTSELKHTIKQIDQIHTRHFIQQTQNTHYSH